MKRTLLMIFIAGGSLIMLQEALAQKPTKTKPVQTTKDKAAIPFKKVPDVVITLGGSGLNNGLLKKKSFDSLMKQGLIAEGGLQVEGFMFDYAERNYYEDSIGNPIRVIEHFAEYCVGNRLSEGVSSSIYQRTKAGDTAFFDQIKVRMADGSEGHGKAMRFVITK